jgi:hypothetical protein
MSIEAISTERALKLALEAHKKNERHQTVAETRYWCQQYKLLAEQFIQAIEQAEQAQPVAWRNAALRVGEDLSSVGPDGYYDMNAEQWLDWAMAQEPRGKTSLTAPPPRQPLTDEQIETLAKQHNGIFYECDINFARAIEAAHGITGEK